MRTTWAGLALLGCVCLWACAAKPPRDYTAASDAARNAYAHGRYDEAATHWERARSAAKRPHHRDEAVYRKAASLERAGRSVEASLLYAQLARDSPNGERAPRAAYDHARLVYAAGDVAQAERLWEALVLRYPDSGLAPRAIDQRLRHLDVEESIVLLESLLRKLDQTTLAETVLYRWGDALYRAQRLEDARAKFTTVAERFPYPHGALWDDALWRAAQIDVELGEPRRAVDRLRGMLAQRESSHVQGSYERRRYAEARYRIAELYRDALADPRHARLEFRRVWTDHPTSRLRDDAQWQIALIAVRSGDVGGACEAVNVLVKRMPESRYAPCAGEVCPDAAKSDRECHGYIARGAALH